MSKNGLPRDANSAGQPAPPGRGGPSCDAKFRGRVVPGQSLQNVPRCQYRGHLFKPIAMPIPQRTSMMPNSVVNSLHDANSVNFFYIAMPIPRVYSFIAMPIPRVYFYRDANSAKER